jgi:hypothetical protein
LITTCFFSRIFPQVFCAQVRVCDSCFDKYGPKETAAAAGAAATAATAVSSLLSSKEADLPAEYLASPLSKQSQVNFFFIFLTVINVVRAAFYAAALPISLYENFFSFITGM